MEKIQYIVKGFFNTVLPFVDLGTDIKFTYDMYLNNDNFQLVHMLRDCYKSENEQINCVFIISGRSICLKLRIPPGWEGTLECLLY